MKTVRPARLCGTPRFVPVTCSVCLPGKHKTFTKCWFNAGPTSQTLGRHWTDIGWTSLVDLSVGSPDEFTTKPNAPVIIVTISYSRPAFIICRAAGGDSDVNCSTCYNFLSKQYWGFNCCRNFHFKVKGKCKITYENLPLLWIHSNKPLDSNIRTSLLIRSWNRQPNFRFQRTKNIHINKKLTSLILNYCINWASTKKQQIQW